MKKLTFTNILSYEGYRTSLSLPFSSNINLDASRYLLLPALIDPHVHFRCPGFDYKEDWNTGAKAALSSGITTVIDMPNTNPSGTSHESLLKKEQMVLSQLNKENLPLNFSFYLGATQEATSLPSKLPQRLAAIKVFMGSSTGNLLVEKSEHLEQVFTLAKQHNLMIAVHSEDEQVLKAHSLCVKAPYTSHSHSKLRHRQAAITSTQRIISFSQKFKVPVIILHTSTKEEVLLIKKAKKQGIPIFAETSPHHLFMNTSAYKKIGMLAKMNPPLREKEDNQALWQGIKEGVIDTIGTDHAPHLLEEKQQSYDKAPAGIPGLETFLPLMLQAVHDKKITIKDMVRICRNNALDIYRLSPNQDWIIVDLEHEEIVGKKPYQTKCQWSPYEGQNLKGWPVLTICKNRIFQCHPFKEISNSYDLESLQAYSSMH
jgi:dihydroorotase